MPPFFREPSLLDRLKHAARDFCLNTALHGFRFIVLPRRILLERVVWAVICFISIIVVVGLLLTSWFSFQRNPTILVTDSNHYRIWNYDFPAVSVCNFNKFSKRKVYELARNISGSNENSTEIQRLALELRLALQLIKNTNPVISPEGYYNLQHTLDQHGISVDSLLVRLSPRCEDFVQRCIWKGEEQRCENLFSMIRTQMGFCCSFNYFALKNRTYLGNSKSSLDIPKRVSSCGQHTGLEFLLDNQVGDYFAAFLPSTGHKIVVHSPYHFPDSNEQALLCQDRTLNLISVRPYITFSDEVEELRPSERQCLFPYERKLIHFRHYNYHNCMVECRMNLTYTLCKCIPYYYVQDRGMHNDKKICNLIDVMCLTKNQHIIYSTTPKVDDSELNNMLIARSSHQVCNCLPDCEVTSYVSEMSSGILHRKFSLNQNILYGGVKLRNHSTVRVFFNDLVGVKNRRYIKFNWHTLLAFYGGLLGLFLGFSFMSAVEIVYCFVVKLIMGKEQERKIFIRRRIRSVDPRN